MTTLRTFGPDGRFLDSLTDWDDLELSWNLRGPEAGQVSMAVASVRAQKGAIRADNIGAYIVADASDVGVSEPWVGRIETVPGSSSSPQGTLGMRGPESWLDRRTVAAQKITSGTSVAVLADVIAGHPVDLRLSMGQVRYRGAVGQVDLAGQTVWALMGELEDMRGCQVRLRGRMDATLAVEVHDPAGALDLSSAVTLSEGRNAEFDFEHDLVSATVDYVGVADSLSRPGGVLTSTASAPAVLLGQSRAYAAVTTMSTGLGMTGGGTAVIAPEIPNGPMLDAALDARLRRTMVLPTLAQCRVTDTALWSSLWPGVVVGVRAPSDPLGDFDRALGLIEQITFRVTPPLECTVAITLWALEP